MKNKLPDIGVVDDVCTEGGFVEMDASDDSELELEAHSIFPPDIHVLKSGSGVPCMMSHVF